MSTVFRLDPATDPGARARFCADPTCRRTPRFVVYPERRFVCARHAPPRPCQFCDRPPVDDEGWPADCCSDCAPA